MLKLSKGIYFRNMSNSSHDLTITEWLTKLGQGKKARETLWDIIILATMNENPDKSSAAIFKTVLKRLSLKNGRDQVLYCLLYLSAGCM